MSGIGLEWAIIKGQRDGTRLAAGVDARSAIRDAAKFRSGYASGTRSRWCFVLGASRSILVSRSCQ